MDSLHPKFEGLARAVFVNVSELAERCGYTCYVAADFRDPEKQDALYRRGRIRNNKGQWIRQRNVPVVTNAHSRNSPHCVTLEGKPASMAIDIAIVDGNAWLADAHPGWGIIGTAISMVDPEHKLIEWGAHWRSLRDWPHVQYKHWRKHRWGK